MMHNLNYVKKIWLAWLVGLLLLSACQTTAVMEKRPSTIAVWDLENLNPAELEEFDLEELLAAKVIESFQTSKKWTVVERKDLILALEEQNLGSSVMVDESMRLKIGELLGANYMVFGSYMKFRSNITLTLRLVDVQTGRILKAEEITNPFKSVSDTLQMATKAAKQLQGNKDNPSKKS